MFGCRGPGSTLLGRFVEGFGRGWVVWSWAKQCQAAAMPRKPAVPRVVTPAQSEHVAVLLNNDCVVPAILRALLGDDQMTRRYPVPILGKAILGGFFRVRPPAIGLGSAQSQRRRLSDWGRRACPRKQFRVEVSAHIRNKSFAAGVNAAHRQGCG